MQYLSTSKGQNVMQLCVSIISALLFLLICLIVMDKGHLHEDAYILYIYAENWVETGVISYFPGGERAEGATDFLWMAAIAVLNYLGLSSGMAAAFLNTTGIFVIVYLLIMIARKFHGSWLVWVFIATFVPFSHLAQASMVGFSTSLYSALITCMVTIILFSRNSTILLVPILGLLIALVRPDGVIIGGLTTMMTFFIIDKHLKRNYLLITLLSALVGLLYFIWRWQYFGQFLPLPLVVKSSSDTLLPGFRENLTWLLKMVPLLVLFVMSMYIRPTSFKRILVSVLPIGVYFLAITFAVQSQNVGARFQAPILVILLIFSVISISYFTSRQNIDSVKSEKEQITVRRTVFVFSILLVFLIALNIKSTVKLVREATDESYINFFPYYLSDHVEDDTIIALTEAGRLAYWMPGKKYDLVGLNTAETAIDGASPEYIKNLNADLIFIHHAGLLGHMLCDNGEAYCVISHETMSAATVDGTTTNYLEIENRVTRASAATISFLLENFEEFFVYSVFYNSSNTHVYALRKDGNITQKDFEAALTQSFDSKNHLSYFDMQASNR